MDHGISTQLPPNNPLNGANFLLMEWVKLDGPSLRGRLRLDRPGVGASDKEDPYS